jgi:hypothetical protein
LIGRQPIAYSWRPADFIARHEESATVPTKLRTRLIAPDGLETDAVVPQCLDNQYVSDSLFEKMTSKALDFRDRDISLLREQNFRTEFIRSLIYSSQVVIQRAFLWNSEFLFKNFLPEANNDFHAFSQLIRDKAIVPFLFTESSFDDDHAFDRITEGVRATRALLAELDEVLCVRLAIDGQANKEACARMATAFGHGLTRLEHLSDLQRNAMASELFLDKSRLQEPGLWQAFNEAIDRMVDYAIKRNRELRKNEELLRRQHIYEDHFVIEGKDSVQYGRFKRPGRDSPFLLELKKYVDLVYNVNLPDRLKRYTFTPENMPSRMALQDDASSGHRFNHQDVSNVLSNDDALESIRRTFMAHSQNAMTLPLLHELTIADVQQIRALPEWKIFIDSQTGILRNPLQCLDRLERFQEDFDNFQRALSRWYNSMGRMRTDKLYCSYISLALSLGGKLIVAKSHINEYGKVVAHFAVDRIVDFVPEKVKEYAAKIMVNVYDIGAKKLDADRSYSIELMRANADLVREDIEALIRSITTEDDNPLPSASEQVADQGIQ